MMRKNKALNWAGLIFGVLIYSFLNVSSTKAATVDIYCNDDGTIYSTNGNCATARAGSNLSLNNSYIEIANDLYNNNYEIERGYFFCDFSNVPGWPGITVTDATLHTTTNLQSNTNNIFAYVYDATGWETLETEDFNNYTTTKASDDSAEIGQMPATNEFVFNANEIDKINSNPLGYYVFASSYDVESENCYSGNSVYGGFKSSTAANPTERPYITVTYTTEATENGTPPGITIPKNQICANSNCILEVDVAPGYLPSQWAQFALAIDNTDCATTSYANVTSGYGPLTSLKNYFYTDAYTLVPNTFHSICYIFQDLTDGKYKYASSTIFQVRQTVITTLPTSTPALVDTYHLACTDEEWTASSTFLGLNLIQFKCLVFYSAINLGDQIANLPAYLGNIAINTLKGIFPFSIPAKINDCWQQSETVALPETIDWLEPNNDYSINIEIPDLGQGATSSLQLWGPDVFAVNQSEEEFFDHIRTISTFVEWITFLALIILLGNICYNEIRYNQHEQKIQEEDYQL